MWLVDRTMCGVAIITISRLQALWLASESLGFPLIPRIKSLRGPHSLSKGGGRPPLRAGFVLGPLHFCCIPGRKAFQFSMFSFKRQSLSRAEPPALVCFCLKLCTGTGLTPGQCHCRLHCSLVSQHSSSRS